MRNRHRFRPSAPSRGRGRPPSPVAAHSGGPGERKVGCVFGRRPVLEALHARKRTLQKLWLQKGTEGTALTDILRLARELQVPLEWVEQSKLDQLSSGGHHQGVAAHLEPMGYWELDDFLKPDGPLGDGPALLVALDEIQDPQNVGAILRSAGFFGVAGILLPRWRGAPVGDVAWRVSAGAAEHLSFVRVTNIAAAILTVKDAGFQVLGADMAGGPAAAVPNSPRTMIVLGNEGKGLRHLVAERCDRLVRIPGAGTVDSLNVGAAAAILLYEFAKSLRN